MKSLNAKKWTMPMLLVFMMVFMFIQNSFVYADETSDITSLHEEIGDLLEDEVITPTALSAQITPFATSITVASYEEFKIAIESIEEDGIITLSSDIIDSSSGGKTIILNKSVIIDCNGYEINIGNKGIKLQDGGRLIVQDAKITSTQLLKDSLNGFFCVESGDWEIEFYNLEFDGISLVGAKSTKVYADKVRFSGKTNVKHGYKAHPFVTANSVIIGDVFEENTFIGESEVNSQFFKSKLSVGSFVVKKGAVVEINRSYSAGDVNLIEGFGSYIFEENCKFNASAKTNRVYTIVLGECGSAIIRSDETERFDVKEGAEVNLTSTPSNEAKNDGHGVLILGKSDSGLKMNIEENAKLNLYANGNNKVSYGQRGHATFSILGNGNSDIVISGDMKVDSNTGNGWFYQFNHKGINNLIIESNGSVDIDAKAGGVMGAFEYAAFEAYGKHEMNIVLENGAKMNISNLGYRGMSLAGSGSYAKKTILVKGDGSELNISGSTWAIAAETQPTLIVEAIDGGKINLKTNGGECGTMASSTVYSVGPTTYNVDGEGSEINFTHEGGAYSAIFHDGYGKLHINITNGGVMDVYNNNTQKDKSARRAAITAQSTNASLYTDTDGNKTENKIYISGEGSTLKVLNLNPNTHGGADTGLYPTGAISFNCSAYGSIVVEDGGNLYAESNSLAPTIHLYDRTLKLDNPGEVSIINQSTDSTQGAYKSYSTEGMAIANYRYTSEKMGKTLKLAPAIDATNFDIEVWKLKGNTSNWDISTKYNEWKNTTFQAKNGETIMIPGGMTGDTFTLDLYGRINGSGQFTKVDTDASKTSKNITSKDGKTHVGDVVEYTIDIKNTSTKGTWYGVEVEDILPEGITFVKDSVLVNGTKVSYTYYDQTRTLIINVGDINSSEQKVITFEAEVDKGSEGKTIINAAKIIGKDNFGKNISVNVEEKDGNTVESKEKRVVKGTVYPIVPKDHPLGEDFVKLFDITVELRPTFLTPAASGLSTIAQQIGTTENGEFVFDDVEAGKYVLVIKRPGYLIRTMNVVIDENDPMLIVLTPPGETVFDLWGGDVDGSWLIDAKDIELIQNRYGYSYGDIEYISVYDLNYDGKIDSKDVEIGQTNLHKTIMDYNGSEDVDFGN